MKRIELIDKKYQYEFTTSQELVFYLTKDQSVESDIVLLIRAKNKKHDIVLNFIANKDQKIDIDLRVIVPRKSTGNKISVNINSIQLTGTNMIRLSPTFELNNNSTVIKHSTTIGSINEKWRDYFQSRGIDKKEMIELFSQSFENKID